MEVVHASRYHWQCSITAASSRFLSAAELQECHADCVVVDLKLVTCPLCIAQCFTAFIPGGVVCSAAVMVGESIKLEASAAFKHLAWQPMPGHVVLEWEGSVYTRSQRLCVVTGWVPRQPPAEQRALQWLAFAKQCLGNSNACSTWDLPAFATVADALASHPPYRVPLSNFRVVLHHAKLAAPLVPQALNGAVVAFTCAASNDTISSGSSLDSAEAKASWCLAIGIVRTVDAAKELLYILTTAPLEVLKQSTTIEVSICILLFMRHKSTDMPETCCWSCC